MGIFEVKNKHLFWHAKFQGLSNFINVLKAIAISQINIIYRKLSEIA